jgi:hypothetical protein
MLGRASKLLLCTGILAIALPGWAAQAAFEINAGLGHLWGTTTMESGNIPWGKGSNFYVVSDEDPTHVQVYPRTSIDFPLDAFLASIEASYTIGNLGLKASVRTNLNDPKSKAIDNEMAVVYWDEEENGWYYRVYSGGGQTYASDVEQQLDTELDAMMYEVRCRYAFYASHPMASSNSNAWWAYIGLGLDKRDYEFEGEVRRVSTAYFIGDKEWYYPQDGTPRIDYEVHYTIPYLELAGKGVRDNLSVDASVGFSPLVRVKDKQDNHLGRLAGPYTAEGDCKGVAYKASILANYSFTAQWSLGLAFDYLKVRTEGEQDTVCQAGSTAIGGGAVERTWPDDAWENDEKIYSEQYQLMLNLGFHF